MKFRTHAPKLLAFAVSLALASGALADDHHHFSSPHVTTSVHHVDARGAVWGHGDIQHFHDFDFHAWQGGHWTHDWHNNHFGWWWVVGGAWVFFSAPVYPYPDPYVPSTVVVQTAPDPDAMPPAAPPAPAPAYWYYCASAQNYYPYVTQCPVGWEQVPATPAPPAPAPAPAAAPSVPPPGTPPPPPPSGDGNW